MQPLRIAAPLQDSAGELVDDLHLALGDDVVDVPLVELLGPQRVLEVMDERRVDVVVEVVDAEFLLDPVHALFQDRDGLLLFVDLVVGIAPQARPHAREHLVPLGRVGHHPADDERGPRLVDQDRVDLVDDGEVVPALDHVLDSHGHVVAQVVEPELVVGPIADVGGVRRPTLLGAHRGLDQAHGQPEQAVDRAHPFGVSLGQVVVHGDDVNPVAPEGVDVGGHGGDERLSFARLHLGDAALVQGHRPHHLDVEMALSDGPAGGLADQREGLGEHVLQVLALGHGVLQLGGLGGQLVVTQLFELHELQGPDPVALEGVDEPDVFLELLALPPLPKRSQLLQTDQARPSPS